MSDYKIEFFIDGSKTDNIAEPDMIANVKVKHFRVSDDGRNLSPMGGHTAIFDKDTGMVFSARCRPDETFSRRKGILACIQKMVQNKCYADKIRSKQFENEAKAECVKVDPHQSFDGKGVRVGVTYGPADYTFLQQGL